MKIDKNKTTVVVVFGGKSVEHDISIITGIQTLNALKSTNCNLIPIYISKEGKWLTSDKFFDIGCFAQELPYSRNIFMVNIQPNDSSLYVTKNKKQKKICKIDFAFLATHGGQGENGELQGFFDMCGIAYSSPNVYSSAVCMNKLATKYILMQNGISTTPFVHISQQDYSEGFDRLYENFKFKELKYPVIVKPCNLGSSIGITYCHDDKRMEDALSFAFLFDNSVLIETAVENLREVNIAVVGNTQHSECSDVEEVFVEKDFLTFENKYMQDETSKGMESAKRVIPANIDKDTKLKIEQMATAAYKVLGCKGVVRIDFLINDLTNEIFLNELNTIPGSLANYMWKSKGYKFSDLLAKVKNYALEDKAIVSSKILKFSTSVLKKFNGTSKLDVKK